MKYFFCFVLLIVTSCSSFYLPSSHNVPTFSRAGEFHVNGQVQVLMPNFVSSIHVQTACSLTNHIALTANYSSFTGARDLRSDLGEFGLGYYANPSSKKNISFFAGYGVSDSHGRDGAIANDFWRSQYGGSKVSIPGPTYVWSRYANIFFQPAYGFPVSERTNLIVSLKVSRVEFDNISTDDSGTWRQPYGPTYHFEPAATYKQNLRNTNFDILYQFGVHFTNDNQLLDANYFRATCGFQWRLVPKKKE